MYLYNTSSKQLPGLKPTVKESTFLSKTVDTELIIGELARIQLKDNTSAKLQVKGPKQADASLKAELLVLRGQINALPEGLREDARMNFMLDQNIKRKDLQEFQCLMLAKIEAILRQNIISSGGNYEKYRIGGFDKGTYERFFRVEPARFMSKAQLTTALRRSFGNDVITSEASIGRLFDSFDFHKADTMDWRSFLYLLTILMQPSSQCDVLLRWAYALYSSVGSLDLDCTERLPLGTIKDMICTPVLLSMRSEVRHQFDSAWEMLVATDTEVIQYMGRKSNFVADPDDLKLTHRLLQKVYTQTHFSEMLRTCTVFGKKDTRPWTSVLEEHYYHPMILSTIKERRRETRNDAEADQFIALSHRRRKAMYLSLWRKFVARRNFLRVVVIGMEIRTHMSVFGVFYDHWKKLTIQIHSAELIQRYIRGFNARKRRNFIKRIQHKVTMMQSGARQLMTKRKFKLKKAKLFYAAMTIQRVVRGRQARKRVASIVKAYYDTQMRVFLRDKANWILMRQVKAAVKLQMYARRFILRQRRIKIMEQKERVADMEAAMADDQERQRVAEAVYRTQLSEWYQQRKRTYDEGVLNEKQSAAQKKIIMARKSKKADELKAAKKLEREENLQRLQDEVIELWIKRWEDTIQKRGAARRIQCRNCLLMPETPEDIILKKDLLKRIKKNLKEVLRSADKQKIPMELPEANEISTTEIIEVEVLAEMDRARAEMKAEATLRQQEEEQKQIAQNDKEKQEKRRKRRWALLIIQAYVRAFLARKVKRMRAYSRYTKHFDPVAHEYYYQDKRTKKSTWKKPTALGSYDVEMEDHWMVIHDANNPAMVYYYNPCTWAQIWEQPLGTILCAQCQVEFAICMFLLNNSCYCDACFKATAVQYVEEYNYGAKEVTFKMFSGNKTDSEFTDFYYIEPSNWQMYLMDVNPQLKLSEEEELQEEILAEKRRKKAAARAAQLKQMKICPECRRVDAEINCYECGRIYCSPCFHHVHSSSVNKQFVGHVPTKLVLDKYITLPDIFAQSKKHKVKKGKKKSHNSESDTDYLSEAERHSDGTAGKKKKKKKVKAITDGTATSSGGELTSDASPTKKKKKNKDVATALVPIGDATRTGTGTGSRVSSANASKKKKKKNVSGLDDTGSSVDTAATPSSAAKKKKKKNPVSDSLATDTALEPLMSAPVKPKKRKPKSTSDVFNDHLMQLEPSTGGPTESSPTKKKKKKKQGSVSDADSEGTKKKKKKKKVLGEDGYSTGGVSGLSESEGEPKKKKKKKKVTADVDKA